MINAYAIMACLMAILDLIENGFNLANHGTVCVLNIIMSVIALIWFLISIAAIFLFRSQNKSVLSPSIFVGYMSFFTIVNFQIPLMTTDWGMWLAIAVDLWYFGVNISLLQKSLDKVIFACMSTALVAVGCGAWFVAKPLALSPVPLINWLTATARNGAKGSLSPIPGMPTLTGDISGCFLQVFVSTDDSVQGTLVGSHSWGEGESNNLHFSYALTPKVKNYVHILVQPPANSRVFFGYFTVSGGPKFAATGTAELDSRPDSWHVSLNGWGTGYRTPAVAPESKKYVSQDPAVDQLDPNAQTLMDPVSGVNGQQNVYFSTVINSD